MTSQDAIHIAMASNRRYLPGLRATIVSLINATSCPKRLRFHVFSDGLTQDDKNSLEELSRKFGYDLQFDFRDPDMSRLSRILKAYNGSHTTYLRLFFPKFFPDLKWVLWTDVDVLWFRDPSKLWEERDDSVSIVWVQDMPSSRETARKQAVKWRRDFDASEYGCAGVMLMNLKKMRDRSFVDKWLEFIEEWGSPIFADQDILNEICYKDTKQVDQRWDLLNPIHSVEDGVVVHFNGIGYMINDAVYSGLMPLYEIWFRYVHQVVNGHEGEQVCPLWKRTFFTAVSLFYPIRRLIAFFTRSMPQERVDFIQRTLMFCWLRRKPLWQH